MTETDLPHSVWSGSFFIFGVEMKCHTLSDGSRVIDAESTAELFKAMGNPDSAFNVGDMDAFAKWHRGGLNGS